MIMFMIIIIIPIINPSLSSSQSGACCNAASCHLHAPRSDDQSPGDQVTQEAQGTKHEAEEQAVSSGYQLPKTI
jgi:hypothetical protein